VRAGNSGKTNCFTVPDRVVEQLIPVDTREAIAQIASKFAQDAEMGELIPPVMDKVDKDDAITVEDSNIMFSDNSGMRPF
jgi:hypothetical protein